MHAIDNTPPLWLNTLCLCINQRQLTCDNRHIALTGLEFEILYVLMRNAGNIVSRASIQQNMQTKGISYSDNSLAMHVSNVRKKLLHSSCEIQTIRGSGYLIRQVN